MQQVEETYCLYLRFVWMFINLTTETVLSLFRHLIKSDDISAFLTSREIKQHIENLMRKKVLNRTDYEKVTTETENPDQYDLTLLITLIINLIPANELPPPKKGWDNPPKPSDTSIAADLLRLRKILNVIVAHSPKAELEKERFENLWTEVTDILIKVQKEISKQELKGRGPEFEQEFKRRIEDYRHKTFDSCQKRIEDLIKEWKDATLEVQAEADRLLEKIAEFDRYFKSHSNRYNQYICLLDKGGHFVLSSYLKLKLKESCSDFMELLRQKESSLRKEIKDTEQLALLFIQKTSSSTNIETVVQSLNISTLAVVILHVFRNDDEEIRGELKFIQSAHKTYAEIPVKALDTDDTFDDVLSDLKASLKFISKFLLKER